MRRRMRREVYRGRIVDLGIERVTLPNGKDVELEVIRHRGASAVAAVDAGGRVTLIHQFRHAAGGFIWELPAGVLDKPDETPVECAGRELLEETGLRAGRFTHLATILTTPGFTDERIHLFLAQDLQEERPAVEDDEAISEVRRVPLGEALAMVPRGEILDAKTICGLHLTAARLGVTP
jgi:8-oxo-dGTP pyrophosphatase MutT (NUDIX family)